MLPRMAKHAQSQNILGVGDYSRLSIWVWGMRTDICMTMRWRQGPWAREYRHPLQAGQEKKTDFLTAPEEAKWLVNTFWVLFFFFWYVYGYISYIHACMCMHVPMCVGTVWMWVHLPTGPWGWLVAFLGCYSPYIVKQHLLSGLRVPCFGLPCAGLVGRWPCPPHFYMGAADLNSGHQHHQIWVASTLQKSHLLRLHSSVCVSGVCTKVLCTLAKDCYWATSLGYCSLLISRDID